MIKVYFAHQSHIQCQEITPETPSLLADALWIDLLTPTKEEEKMVENYLHLDIPTREEMQEIEPSSRLYKENSALYMTATMIAKSDTPDPRTDAVTFILTEKKLVTIRYIEPHSFSLFTLRLTRLSPEEYLAENFLVGLLESTVDRLADILENISRQLDQFSQLIFRPKAIQQSLQKLDYQQLLQDIGSNGDLGTKVRESLVSFNRMVFYLGHTVGSKLDRDTQMRMETVTKDINALSDHASFIANKVTFLLDATLGMVNIEQNNIIKIFSVAAVIFLPPTLIASIYGMNFRVMPELNWYVGYPIAIVLMLISAWLPYRYFKKRKWL